MRALILTVALTLFLALTFLAPTAPASAAGTVPGGTVPQATPTPLVLSATNADAFVLAYPYDDRDGNGTYNSPPDTFEPVNFYTVTQHAVGGDVSILFNGRTLTTWPHAIPLTAGDWTITSWAAVLTLHIDPAPTVGNSKRPVNVEWYAPVWVFANRAWLPVAAR